MERKYRLEVCVRRIYGLQNVSSQAKLRFVVRFASFPKFFINPQVAHGGGLAERTPSGDGVLSLTYNTMHSAAFMMTDDELNSLRPLSVHCQIFDEQFGHQHLLMSFSVPLSVALQQTADQNRNAYAMYSMQDSYGATVGFADMFARIVVLDRTPPPSHFAGGGGYDTASAPQEQVPGNWVNLSPPIVTAANGKPYMVRVVANEGYHARGASGGGGGGGKSDKASKKPGPSVAKKKTLLHLLQYDVAYQLLSSSETMAATLRREFDRLDAVALPPNEPVLMPITNSVHSVARLTNIALQIASGLVTERTGSPPAQPDAAAVPASTTVSAAGGGAAATQQGGTKGSQPDGQPNPRNYHVKVPRPGSVAGFLQYEVLFQLQCLTTHISYITEHYRNALQVPLGSLHKQHVGFFRKLCKEIGTLNRWINIVVQSSIDGLLGKKDGFATANAAALEEDYSSDSDDDSDSSSSSSSEGGTVVKEEVVRSAPPPPPPPAPAAAVPLKPVGNSAVSTTGAPIPHATAAAPYSATGLPVVVPATLPLPPPPQPTATTVPGSSTAAPLTSQIFVSAPLPPPSSSTAVPPPPSVAIPSVTQVSGAPPGPAAAAPMTHPTYGSTMSSSAMSGNYLPPTTMPLSYSTVLTSNSVSSLPLPSSSLPPPPTPAAYSSAGSATNSIPLPQALPSPAVPTAAASGPLNTGAAQPLPTTASPPASNSVPLPQPVVVPQPVPVPMPVQVPAPQPVPTPQPVQAPQPLPVPMPRPVPQPVPGPQPAPVPVPQPVSVPTHQPVPMPMPLPVPAGVSTNTNSAAVPPPHPSAALR